MIFKLILKALAIWLLILMLAILNGLFREYVLLDLLSIVPGMILSGIILSSLIYATTYLLLPWLNTRAPTRLIAVGIGWLLLTLIFEFSFGLLQGKPLDDILAAYRFTDGNIWPLVLLVTALSPWLAARIRGWI